MEAGQTGRRGIFLMVALLFLAGVDPLVGLWARSISPEEVLESLGYSELFSSGSDVFVLEPVAAHALGVPPIEGPALWGTDPGFDLPEGLPSSSRVRDGDIASGSYVSWSLRDRLSKSTVEVASRDSVEPCAPFDGMRSRCGSKSYEFVGKYAGTIQGLDIPCVWLHPTEKGALVVRLKGLPVTSQIIGFAGLLDGAGKRADVHLEGRFNSQRIFKSTLNADRKFVSLGSELTDVAAGDFEISVRAKKTDWRLLCVAIYGIGDVL